MKRTVFILLVITLFAGFSSTINAKGQTVQTPVLADGFIEYKRYDSRKDFRNHQGLFQWCVEWTETEMFKPTKCLTWLAVEDFIRHTLKRDDVN